MKTLKEKVEDLKTNKYYAVFDREDIMWNFYYTKEEADEAAQKLNKETPSLNYVVKEINKSDIEK